MILVALISFFCDVCRCREVSYLAGAFISQPDCQHVVRLPLYVPQLGMNCRRVCCCSLVTCTERVVLGHVCGPGGHSAEPENITFLTVTYCLVKIQMSADRFSALYLPFDWSYKRTVWWNQTLHDSWRRKNILAFVIWPGFVSWFVTAPLTCTHVHV